MERLPRGVPFARLLQEARFTRQGSAHGCAVAALRIHAFPQQVANDPRQARVVLGSPHTSPAGNLFVDGNGDVFHATILVSHGFRVNAGVALRRPNEVELDERIHGSTAFIEKLQRTHARVLQRITQKETP